MSSNKYLEPKDLENNPDLKFAMEYEYPPYSTETGVSKILTGENSHKCPVYVKRVPPCTNSCPAGEDIRGYQNILRGVEVVEGIDDKWEAAWRRLVDSNPFPAVMGRICPAPCEGGCNRGEVDETVGINSIEHALGEYALEKGFGLVQPGQTLPAETGKKVAVIGAGPAGLSTAYQLRKKGHAVTIYESQQKTGGMMRYGIMGYRVDRKILDAEIQRILDLGVELKTGVSIGTDVSLNDLEKQYDAVFLGPGAQQGRNLPVTGFENSPYVSNAIKFLMDYEQSPEKMTIGKNIVVLGDGDVAMDVARLALRLGSKATILSAVDREDMNCSKYEFDEAVTEGTEFTYNTSVTEVLKDGEKVRALKCVKMVKKEKGEDGWNHAIPFLRYKPLEGSEFELETDMVVASIGQTTNMKGFEEVANKKGMLPVDVHHQVKDRENIFAGGDAVKIDLITTAVGHGKKAAESIDVYLSGKPYPAKTRYEIADFKKMHPYFFEAADKSKRGHRKIENVVGNFEEILEPLNAQWTEWEANRCMSCGLCFTCKQCLLYCPKEAISFDRKKPIGETMFTDYNKCVGCHVCHDICPSGYIDMAMGEDL
ncbi:MAG: NAD(P)-binding protein [Leptospirales bacterium]